VGRLVIACAALAWAFVMGLRSFGGLESLELRAWDALLHARTRLAPARPPRVAVVRVEEADIQRFGYPLSDALLATAISRLLEGGATAVGVDLYRDRPVPPGHAALRSLVLSDARVSMVEKIAAADSPGVGPPDFLRGPAAEGRVGFSDLVIDHDGVVRRALLFLWDATGRAHASLATQLALRHLDGAGIHLVRDAAHPDHLHLGTSTLTPLTGEEGGYVRSDAGGYQILLDYGRATSRRPTLSFGQLMDGSVPPDFAEGRVVLMGTRSPSVRDDFLTPLDARLAMGVDVHADTADQLLREALDGDRPIRAWAWPGTTAAVAALALLGAAAGVGVRSPWALAGALATALALLAATSVVGLVVFSLWLPAPPAALGLLAGAGAGVAAAAQRERVERAFMVQLFGRYLSPGVADHLRARRDEFVVGGRPRPQRLVETILMIDIESSSLAAEQMPSDEFVSWIASGLGTMARIAEDHGGIVEYFSGDGLKVDFGVPIPRKNPVEVAADARSAVRAALAGAAALHGINAAGRAAGRPPMRIRMGIHTGETVAGSVGSERRLQYTTLGGAANLAARIEGYDKESFRHDRDRPECRILVSEATLRLLEELLEEEGADASRSPSETASEIRSKPVSTVALAGSCRLLAVYAISEAG